MTSRFDIAPPPGPVASCLFRVLQHREYGRAVAGLAVCQVKLQGNLRKFGDVCSIAVSPLSPGVLYRWLLRASNRSKIIIVIIIATT